MNLEIFMVDSGLKGVRRRKLKAYEPEHLDVVVEHEELESAKTNEQKFKVEDNETIADCLARMREEGLCQLVEWKNQSIKKIKMEV